MIRSKGEAGTGNIVEAVRHLREITGGDQGAWRRSAPRSSPAPPRSSARRSRSCARSPRRRLPVPLFCAGGIATPADAALMMQLGAEGNFVGSGIFKSEDPSAARGRSSRRRRTSTTPSGSPRPRAELG